MQVGCWLQLDPHASFSSDPHGELWVIVTGSVAIAWHTIACKNEVHRLPRVLRLAHNVTFFPDNHSSPPRTSSSVVVVVVAAVGVGVPLFLSPSHPPPPANTLRLLCLPAPPLHTTPPPPPSQITQPSQPLVSGKHPVSPKHPRSTIVYGLCPAVPSLRAARHLADGVHFGHHGRKSIYMCAQSLGIAGVET